MTHSLDVQNLLCPLPVIKTQDRVAELDSGDILEITATDPGALHDIPAWCRIHGHTVLVAEHRAEDVFLRIKVC